MHTLEDVSRAEQGRALGLSTVAFTACFAVWTIFSIIGVAIKKELSLTEFQFGLLVATPILTGSLTRLFLGVWTEKWGGRIVFSVQMILTGLATWMLTWAHTYPMYLIAALGVGLAGGSFIIGVAYVSRWYPAGRQGTALAARHSDCGSRMAGGALGQLGPGDTVPEFEAALRGLAERETTSAPVLTRHGYHIIRMDALALGAELPFETVQPRIATALEKAAWSCAARDFISNLVAGAKITGAELGAM